MEVGFRYCRGIGTEANTAAEDDHVPFVPSRTRVMLEPVRIDVHQAGNDHPGLMPAEFRMRGLCSQPAAPVAFPRSTRRNRQPTLSIGAPPGLLIQVLP